MSISLNDHGWTDTPSDYSADRRVVQSVGSNELDTGLITGSKPFLKIFACCDFYNRSFSDILIWYQSHSIVVRLYVRVCLLLNRLT